MIELQKYLNCPLSSILKFSIIIPAKNEEQRLAGLLDSISAQTLQPAEVIVASASTDNTAKVARSYGCTVVKGDGNGYIGKARNNGAKVAKSPLLLFLDADMNLTKDTFIEQFIKKFTDNNIDVATCYILPSSFGMLSCIWFSFSNVLRLVDSILKRPFKINEAVILVRRNLWKEVGGFDETVQFDEGSAFFGDIVKMGYRYDALLLTVETSVRRSKVLSIGYFWTWLKYYIGRFVGGRFLKKAHDDLAYLYWGTDSFPDEPPVS